MATDPAATVAARRAASDSAAAHVDRPRVILGFARPLASDRRCLECGAWLPVPPRTGRPRLFCQAACRRTADHRRRRIRSREAALAAWRALLTCRRADRAPYSRDQVRREIRELVAEIYVLQHRRPG